MRYAAIKYNDIANGAGVRTSLFVSGCNRHCPGCFNQKAWDFEYGEEFTRNTEDSILTSIQNQHISGLSILGGEPLERQNRPTVLRLLRKFRQCFQHKDIWLFTGLCYEELLALFAFDADIREILSLVDVLKDGAFIEAQRDVSLQFRGSRNQRLIDVPASLAAGEIILWKDSYK